MKIAAAGDTHGRWGELDYPEADILVLAGDIVHNYNNDHPKALGQWEELARLNAFVPTLGYKSVVLIAGNHCWYSQKYTFAEIQAHVPNMIYLNQTKALVRGIKFWGAPDTVWFGDWSASFPNPSDNPARARAYARNTWAKIPDDVEVLVTHQPALGIRDWIPNYLTDHRGNHVGCPELVERVKSLSDIRLHITAHLHSNNGIEQVGNYLAVGASICNEAYAPIQPIQVVEI